MRKIERQMLQAIVDDRPHWSKDNTRVETEEHLTLEGLKQYRVTVYLHGHRIAVYYPSNSTLHINNCGYQTNTTKSRLNVLIDFVCGGVNNGIYQKNWNWFLTRNGVDEDFPSNQWVAL